MSINLIKKIRKPSEEFKTVVRAINRCLEGDWSKSQLERGMMFEIRQYWRPFYKDLIKKYKGVGWTVQTQVELLPGKRNVFMNIQHPSWVRRDD